MTAFLQDQWVLITYFLLFYMNMMMYQGLKRLIILIFMTLRFLTDLVILVHGQSFNNEHPPLQKKIPPETKTNSARPFS